MPTQKTPSIKIPDDKTRSRPKRSPGKSALPPAQPGSTTTERITNIRANANGITGGVGAASLLATGRDSGGHPTPTPDTPSIKIPDDKNPSAVKEPPDESTPPPVQPDPTTTDRITNIRANATGIGSLGLPGTTPVSTGPVDPK